MLGGKSRMRFGRLCTLGLTLAGTVGHLFGGASGDAGVVTALSGLESPQAITADDQSAPFIALADGTITQLVARETAVPLVETGGLPAGLAFDAAGDLGCETFRPASAAATDEAIGMRERTFPDRREEFTTGCTETTDKSKSARCGREWGLFCRPEKAQRFLDLERTGASE